MFRPNIHSALGPNAITYLKNVIGQKWGHTKYSSIMKYQDDFKEIESSYTLTYDLRLSEYM